MLTNLPANAGDARGMDLIPGSGRSPEGGTDNPLQYSCLEWFMDRGAWRATVYWSGLWLSFVCYNSESNI